MKRYSAVGLLLLGLISSAGCGEMHFGITINQDGSIDDRQSVSLNQSSQQLMNLSNSKISELSDKAKKDGYSVTESPNGFIIVFRLVRDVVANHKTTRYAGAATKVIQKNHLA